MEKSKQSTRMEPISRLFKHLIVMVNLGVLRFF